MKLKSLLILPFVALLALPVQAQAPLKIAYTSPELILAAMPEARQVEQQLTTHQQKLQEQGNVKVNYYQTKVGEYQSNKQKGMTPEADQAAVAELQKLEGEIRQFQEEGRASIARKQEELLGPLLERIQKAIEEEAKAGGYTYVFNIGGGQSGNNILYGPPTDNITEAVMKRLGIDVEALKNQSAQTATPPAGGSGAAPAGGNRPAPAPAGNRPAPAGGARPAGRGGN